MPIDQFLADLVSHINIISKQKSLAETCKKASEQIIELFEFDYAAISLYDFNNQKISSIEEYSSSTKKKNLAELSLDKWMVHSTYSIKDKDILVQVFRGKRIVTAVGKHVFDNQFDENDPTQTLITESAFNPEIFRLAGHEKIARFYIPIIHREYKLSEPEKDFPLGVIEIAVKETFPGQFSADERTVAKENFDRHIATSFREIKSLENLLQLYTENVAQSVYYFLVEEQSAAFIKEFEETRAKLHNENSLTHKIFATEVVKRISTILGVDWGIISFKTFENDYINYKDRATFFSDPEIENYLRHEMLDNRGDNPAPSMVEHVSKTKLPFFLDDVTLPGQIYLHSIAFPRQIHSEIVIPIMYAGEVIGVVDLYSTTTGYFNAVLAEILTRAFRSFSVIYIAEKKNEINKALIQPTGTWSQPVEVYNQLIELLSDYYATDAVAVWYRDKDLAEGSEFCLYTKKPKKESFFSNFENSIAARKLVYNINTVPETGLINDFEKESSINLFCKNHKVKFYLFFVVKLNDSVEIVVNIFSRLDIWKNATDPSIGRHFFINEESVFLSQIAKKTAMTIQNLRISEALKTMTDPIPDFRVADSSPKQIFQNIVNSAKKASGADIVVLFPAYTGKPEILKCDGISSMPGYVEDSLEKAVFADAIFNDRGKEDPLYIFDSHEDWINFLEASGAIITPALRQKSFRVKHNIASTCAVQLLFGEEPVGVLFFNYKRPQSLNNNTTLRQIILFFSFFAANHVYLNRELDTARKTRDYINHMYHKLIPHVTRAQFYLVVEGASHVLKNAYGGIIDQLKSIRHLTGHQKVSFDKRVEMIENAEKLVTSLLTILKFRDEKTEKSHVDVHKVIKDTIQFFKTKNGYIQYSVQLNDAVPDLYCEEGEFAMIIYNLIYNAITAVEKAKREIGEIKITIGKDSQQCLITVEDNGTGIRHELDEKIYEPGYSTKDNGTGLGLYYIKQTIESFGGTIYHESTYNKFTKFHIKIPVNYNLH